jgi:hypothetical protein
LKGEEFYESINQLNWYEIPLEDQKSVLFIIGMAREPKKISFILKALNLETFMEVYFDIFLYVTP